VHILVVTTVHTPLDARIHHRQIRSLIAAGDAVTYAAPWRATGTHPSAAAEGVRTVDLPRAAGRRRAHALRAARRVIEVEGRRHDLILLHDPELAFAVAGRRHLPPVVLDIHEDLVGSLPDRPWVPGVLWPVVSLLGAKLETWAERHLHLLLAEEGYRERFAGAHPVVPNLPWLPEDPPAAGTDNRVVYVGRLSRGRGAEELVQLGAALVAGDGPILELVGTPDTDVRNLVRDAHDRGVVRWHGFLPNDEAFAVVRGSVAGLSLLHDLPNYRTSMPTKVVEYLAAGIPAITTPLPAAARLVRNADAGIVVPFEDVEATSAAVRRLTVDVSLRERLGRNGRAHVAAELSWDAFAPRFVGHLHELAGARR
jgi:glycosyltransferase involved in cell wall biosynthesis